MTQNLPIRSLSRETLVVALRAISDGLATLANGPAIQRHTVARDEIQALLRVAANSSNQASPSCSDQLLWTSLSEEHPGEGIRVIGAIDDFVVGDIFYGTGSLTVGRMAEEGYKERQMLLCWRYSCSGEAVESQFIPTLWQALPVAPNNPKRAFEFLRGEDSSTSTGVMPNSKQGLSFQARVEPWLLECFGATIAADRQERNHRFVEEALELAQACGTTVGEIYQLVDYVFSREIGDPAQEVGGVMVTLAALCLANNLNMHAAGDRELARIWQSIERIRAKQAAKPALSPLPGVYPGREVTGPQLFALGAMNKALRASHQLIVDGQARGFMPAAAEADKALPQITEALDALVRLEHFLNASKKGTAHG
ncbi:hypothetical protein [Pseudomonas syringae]|uniref:hypothetical protein n=1 Tax=Pseudomonas syringae TaxID=317 RepID=UPI000305C49B|nr:hypothetical protein [Pseudomonas syringae]